MVALIEVDLVPTVIAIGVWLTVSLTLVYYVRKLYGFAIGKVGEIEAALKSNSMETVVDSAVQKYAPAVQQLTIGALEKEIPKIGDELYGSLADVFENIGHVEHGRRGGKTKAANAAIRDGQKAVIQNIIAQKAGPAAAAIASQLGLDEMGVDAIEDNPQIAAMIMQQLNKGGNTPQTTAPKKEGGGWV